MQKYKFLEHTADILFEAYGKTLNEVFKNAALATFDTQVNLKSVKSKIKKIIDLKNENIENLLFDFLEELIYLKDAKYLVFNNFKVKIIKKDNTYSLKAIAEGEKINPKKQELKIDVKAITLHEFFLKKAKNGYKARVILDI